jgi:putative transposase
MTKTYTARRTQDQWKVLVDQWQQSGQTARQFCSDHGLGYASFCQWRNRLKAMPSPGSTEPEASFIDLAALSSSGPSSGWHIVLSLGNGVELKLSQV